MINLGIPTTLGELRKMTEQFPDETLLQFRNEPRHELLFEDEQGLIFQDEDWTSILIRPEYDLEVVVMTERNEIFPARLLNFSWGNIWESTDDLIVPGLQTYNKPVKWKSMPTKLYLKE